MDEWGAPEMPEGHAIRHDRCFERLRHSRPIPLTKLWSLHRSSCSAFTPQDLEEPGAAELDLDIDGGRRLQVDRNRLGRERLGFVSRARPGAGRSFRAQVSGRTCGGGPCFKDIEIQVGRTGRSPPSAKAGSRSASGRRHSVQNVLRWPQGGLTRAFGGDGRANCASGPAIRDIRIGETS